ncbi:MAG: sulfurtransferase [Gemmobacter sp.]
MAQIDLPAGPLAGAEWLAARLGMPGMVIVDCRKGDGYARAHVPGALQLGLDPHLHRPGRVIEPETFAAEMNRLGIGRDKVVIAYDDGNNLFGARFWWVMRYYGHGPVRVLDGGWDGWVGGGFPVTDAAADAATPGDFVPRIVPEMLADTAAVRAAMDDPGTLILDVRGQAEWTRQVATETSMAGHVPGAAHLVWTDVIDALTHRFRPVDALRARFAACGLAPEAAVITYCQGGIRAAHTVLALNRAGFGHVRNYEGSWAEWSRAGMPAAIEPAPDATCRKVE